MKKRKSKVHRGESWRAMCRADAYGKLLKVGSKVTIRAGWFKPGKFGGPGTPGIITGWSGCGVAEVQVNTPAMRASYGHNAKFDVGASDLRKRR